MVGALDANVSIAANLTNVVDVTIGRQNERPHYARDPF